MINTPFGRGARGDGYAIRQAAIDARVPCITTLSYATAAVRSMARVWNVEAKPLQELHALPARRPAPAVAAVPEERRRREPARTSSGTPRAPRRDTPQGCVHRHPFALRDHPSGRPEASAGTVLQDDPEREGRRGTGQTVLFGHRRPSVDPDVRVESRCGTTGGPYTAGHAMISSVHDVSAQTPVRSLEQRMDALRRANEIRIRRSQIKKDLREGIIRIDALLLDPPSEIVTAKILDLLLAVPRVGQVKATSG